MEFELLLFYECLVIYQNQNRELSQLLNVIYTPLNQLFCHELFWNMKILSFMIIESKINYENAISNFCQNKFWLGTNVYFSIFFILFTHVILL